MTTANGDYPITKGETEGGRRRHTHCPHGVKRPDDPAVMPDCGGCYKHNEQVRRIMHADAVFRPFPHYPGTEYPDPKPKLPVWMQH